MATVGLPRNGDGSSAAFNKRDDASKGSSSFISSPKPNKDDSMPRWASDSSGEPSIETKNGVSSEDSGFSGGAEDASSSASRRSTPSPLSIESGFGDDNSSTSSELSRDAAVQVDEPVETRPDILRGPRPTIDDVMHDENGDGAEIFICSVATEVFTTIYADVDPPEYLNALVQVSQGPGDCFTPVHFSLQEGTGETERALDMGTLQCSKISEFLNTYGFSGALPPRPKSEVAKKTLFIGIPCFTEHPEEILPTIESILRCVALCFCVVGRIISLNLPCDAHRNGGDDAPHVHVVLCCDILLNPETRKRIDTIPFGLTWARDDGVFTFTYLNKGLSQFTGKTSSLYLISKYVMARMAKDKERLHSIDEETAVSDIVEEARTFMVLADTRIIYGIDSVSLMFDYMKTHRDVVACTATQGSATTLFTAHVAFKPKVTLTSCAL